MSLSNLQAEVVATDPAGESGHRITLQVVTKDESVIRGLQPGEAVNLSATKPKAAKGEAPAIPPATG